MTNLLDRIETVVVDAASKLSPFLAPLPTAFLVHRATINHLHWPTWVGVVAAVIVESLGLATMTTALELYQYNQTKRKSDPEAPFRLAVLLAMVYLLVATGLTLLLDVIKGLETYAPAIFPSLSVTGVTLLAVRLDHRRRLETIREEKEERKAERKAKEEERKADRKAGLRSVDSDVKQVDNSLDSRILSLYRDDPLLGATEAARRTGVSRQSVYNTLKRLETSGRVRVNGHGVEVLEE